MLRKGTAVFVCAAFLMTAISVPQAKAEGSTASVMAYRSLADDLTAIALPKEIGKIQEIYRGTSDKIVVLIQDAHSIPDAQQSIRSAINHFQTQYGVTLVGLEGASEKLDPQIFRSFPDKELLRKTFDAYSQRGELTGGTAAALFNTSASTYHGIEDWPLYEDGVSYFLKATAMESEIKALLEPMVAAINLEKETVYSKELLEIDRMLANFGENKTDLAQVLNRLSKYRPPPKGSELAVLLEEIQRDQMTDTPIEIEIKKIAEQVASALKSQPLSTEIRQELLEFNGKFQEFRTARTTPQAFALYLKGLVQTHKIRVKVSRKLAYSVENQKRLKDIEGTRLFEEFKRYADSVKESLFQSQSSSIDAERKLGQPRLPIMKEKQESGQNDRVNAMRFLDRQSKGLELIKRLTRLELSFEDWGKMQKLILQLDRWTVAQDGVVSRDEVATLLKKMEPHLAFYRVAEQRDQVFLKNIQSMMEKQDKPSSLLVAGGFHTEGLTQTFKAKGISYVLVMPRIGSIPEEPLYREHMQGQVSWSKYFEVKDGKVNLYDAFVRAARDKLLGEKTASAIGGKEWRDQIIRDLAADGRITHASEYTRFIDETAQASSHNNQFLREKWLANIDRFGEGLKKLQTDGSLNESGILQLIKTITIPDAAGANVLARSEIRADLLPSILREKPQEVRSETRALPTPSVGEVIEPEVAAPAKPQGVEARNGFELLEHVLQRAEKQMIVEIGPGRGEILRLLAKTNPNHQFLGFEPGEYTNVEEALRGVTNATVIPKKVENYGSDLDGKVDLVLILFPSWDLFVSHDVAQKLVALLKPTGQILIVSEFKYAMHIVKPELSMAFEKFLEDLNQSGISANREDMNLEQLPPIIKESAYYQNFRIWGFPDKTGKFHPLEKVEIINLFKRKNDAKHRKDIFSNPETRSGARETGEKLVEIHQETEMGRKIAGLIRNATDWLRLHKDRMLQGVDQWGYETQAGTWSTPLVFALAGVVMAVIQLNIHELGHALAFQLTDKGAFGSISYGLLMFKFHQLHSEGLSTIGRFLDPHSLNGIFFSAMGPITELVALPLWIISAKNIFEKSRWLGGILAVIALLFSTNPFFYALSAVLPSFWKGTGHDFAGIYFQGGPHPVFLLPLLAVPVYLTYHALRKAGIFVSPVANDETEPSTEKVPGTSMIDTSRSEARTPVVPNGTISHTGSVEAVPETQRTATTQPATSRRSENRAEIQKAITDLEKAIASAANQGATEEVKEQNKLNILVPLLLIDGAQPAWGSGDFRQLRISQNGAEKWALSWWSQKEIFKMFSSAENPERVRLMALQIAFKLDGNEQKKYGYLSATLALAREGWGEYLRAMSLSKLKMIANYGALFNKDEHGILNGLGQYPASKEDRWRSRNEFSDAFGPAILVFKIPHFFIAPGNMSFDKRMYPGLHRVGNEKLPEGYLEDADIEEGQKQMLEAAEKSDRLVSLSADFIDLDASRTLTERAFAETKINRETRDEILAQLEKIERNRTSESHWIWKHVSSASGSEEANLTQPEIRETPSARSEMRTHSEDFYTLEGGGYELGLYVSLMRHLQDNPEKMAHYRGVFLKALREADEKTGIGSILDNIVREIQDNEPDPLKKFQFEPAPLETLLKYQSDSSVQAVVELINNGFDAMGDAIGRLGRGVYQAIGLLKSDGDTLEYLTVPEGEPGSQYRIVFKRTGGVIRINFFKAENSGNRPHGTEVIIRKAQSTWDRSEIDARVLQKLGRSRRGRVFTSKDGDATANDLNGFVTASGGNVQYRLGNQTGVRFWFSPDGREIHVLDGGRGLAPLDAKAGMSVIMEALPIPYAGTNPTNEELQRDYRTGDSTANGEEVFWRMGSPSGPRRVIFLVGGTEVETREVFGDGIPEETVIDLPTACYQRESRNKIILDDVTTDALMDIVDRLLEAFVRDPAGTAPVINAVYDVLEKMSRASGKQARKDISRHFRDRFSEKMEAVEQSGAVVLPVREGGLIAAEALAGKIPVYIDERLFEFDPAKVGGILVPTSGKSVWITALKRTFVRIRRLLLLNRETAELYSKSSFEGTGSVLLNLLFSVWTGYGKKPGAETILKAASSPGASTSRKTITLQSEAAPSLPDLSKYPKEVWRFISQHFLAGGREDNGSGKVERLIAVQKFAGSVGVHSWQPGTTMRGSARGYHFLAARTLEKKNTYFMWYDGSGYTLCVITADGAERVSDLLTGNTQMGFPRIIDGTDYVNADDGSGLKLYRLVDGGVEKVGGIPNGLRFINDLGSFGGNMYVAGVGLSNLNRTLYWIKEGIAQKVSGFPEEIEAIGGPFAEPVAIHGVMYVNVEDKSGWTLYRVINGRAEPAGGLPSGVKDMGKLFVVDDTGYVTVSDGAVWTLYCFTETGWREVTGFRSQPTYILKNNLSYISANDSDGLYSLYRLMGDRVEEVSERIRRKNYIPPELYGDTEYMWLEGPAGWSLYCLTEGVREVADFKVLPKHMPLYVIGGEVYALGKGESGEVLYRLEKGAVTDIVDIPNGIRLIGFSSG